MGWKYETNFTQRRSVTDPRKYLREREKREKREKNEKRKNAQEPNLCYVLQAYKEERWRAFERTQHMLAHGVPGPLPQTPYIFIRKYCI